MGTAKYGVRDAKGGLDEARLRELANYDQVRMIEVKLSQGAKPGKGGILPAAKVTDEIARIRGIPKGHDSISPNRHLEIHDAGTLLDFIARVRDISGRPTGFKTVFGSYDWLAEVCEEIHRRGIDSAPDFITVDSGDGGTGAAPMTLLDKAGAAGPREPASRRRHTSRARPPRADQGHRQRQDDQSGGRGDGHLHGSGLRQFRRGASCSRWGASRP